MKKNNRLIRTFESLTIARRITILYGGVFSFALLVVSFFILSNAATVNQNLTKEELLDSVRNIEKFVENGGELTTDNLSGLLTNKYVEVNAVKHGTQEIIKSAIGPPPPFIEGEEGNRENFQKSTDWQRPESLKGREFTIHGDKGKEFVLVERIVSGPDTQYMVQAYKLVPDNKGYVRSFGTRLIILDIIGILGSILVGKYISRIILRPVENIRQTAERISIEDLSQRIAVEGPADEMRELSETFNLMIDRLETAFKKQNQFISDASHELRTPISVIQGYASLVNRWGKKDEAILQEAIDSILSETEHMSTLIKKLLFLAKSDQNRNHVQKTVVSLNDAVREIAREIEVMQTDKQISLKEEAEAVIYADVDLMKQLLWIHTENSIKYTAPGGKIQFRVFQEGGFGCVSVSDNGAGISEEDMPYIFDRFYRADKSRNKEIPGTGLGLSIAFWIAQVNDGTITIESKQGEGSTFIDKFPLWSENPLQKAEAKKQKNEKIEPIQQKGGRK